MMERNSQMHKGRGRRVRKTAFLLAGSILLSSTLPYSGGIRALAAGHEASVSEKLYINMDYYGGVDKANVVKEIRFGPAESHTDHGNYTAIINMTDTQEPVKEGDAVTWQRPEGTGGKLFFQGELEPDNVRMPWSFDLTYKVNGVEVRPEEAGGASGTVEIDIDAIPDKSVSEYMQNNMILLVLIPMDTGNVYSIDAPDSMEASFGNYSGIGFEALPGKEGHFTARFGTDSFESMGVMMIMTPVTAGDISKVKDLKDLKDRFRDDTDAVLDSVEAVLDNVVSMSSQLDKTNQVLDELALGKRKIDESRPIILNGIDVSLQDVRDLAALLAPVDASLKTSQWMVYETNQKLNETNTALVNAGAVMGSTNRRLRTLAREMSSVNTFSIASVEEDLTETRAKLAELKKNLIRGGVAANNLKLITGSAEYQNDVGELLYGAALGYGEYEEAYLPEAVIEVIGASVSDPGTMSTDELKALTPSIALMLDLYDILSEPVTQQRHTGAAVHAATSSDYYEIEADDPEIGGEYYVSAADLMSMIGAFRQAQAGDQTAVPKAVGSFIASKGVEAVDQAAIAARITALAASGGQASSGAAARASRFTGRMASMADLKAGAENLAGNTAYGGAGTSLKDSLNTLSDAGSEALANVIAAYSSANYDDLLRQVDGVITDMDDVLDAGAAVSYQSGRLLDSLRSVVSGLDELTAVMNSYYEDVQTAITGLSNVIEETEKAAGDFARTAQILNDTLRAASEDFSRAGDDSISLGREAVGNSREMIDNTRKMKEAGRDLRKSISDKLDEEEADNNFLNMDPDAPKESFTSSKNRPPESVQIICRTAEISAEDGNSTDAAGLFGGEGNGAGNSKGDAEFPEQPTTFGQRVLRIFATLWDKITGVFRR